MVKITRQKDISGLYKNVIPQRLAEEYPELKCKKFTIYTEGTGDYRPGLRWFRKTTPVARFDYSIRGDYFKLSIVDPSWETRMIKFFEVICNEFGILELIVTPHRDE